MKKIFFILLLLPFFVKAQKPQELKTWGFQNRRIFVDTLLQIPKDTFSVPSAWQTFPFLSAKHDSIYIWNQTYWKLFSSGGSSLSAGSGIDITAGTVSNTGRFGKSGEDFRTSSTRTVSFENNGWMIFDSIPIFIVRKNPAGNAYAYFDWSDNDGTFQIKNNGLLETMIRTDGEDYGWVKWWIRNLYNNTDTATTHIGYSSAATGIQLSTNNGTGIGQIYKGFVGNSFISDGTMYRESGSGGLRFVADYANAPIAFSVSASGATEYGRFQNKKFTINDTTDLKGYTKIWTPLGDSDDSAVVKDNLTGQFKTVGQSSLIGVNIYNSDGTISAARTADGNNIGSLFWTNFADYYITIQTGTGHEFVVQKAGIDRFRADNSNTRVNSPDGASSQLNVTNGQAYYTSQNQLYLAGVANTFLYGGDSLISGSGGTYPTSASGINMYPTKLRMFATSSQDQYAGDSLVWRMTDRSSAFTLLANTAETYAGQNEISLVNPTGITLQPYKQNLYIDSLQHTLTATAKMVTWDSVTGRIETRAIPTGTSGLTVGITTITSGTTTRILYDNAGVLGEYTVTGSGTTAVLSTTPTFTTSIIAPLHIGSTSADGTVTLQGNNAGAGNTATSQNIILSVGNTPTKFFDILNNGVVRVGSGNTTTSGFGLVVDQPDDGTDLKGIRVSSNNHTATLDIGYDKIQTSGANKIGTASGGVQLYGASGASVNISTSAAVPTSTLTVDGSIGWKLSSSAIDVTLTAVMSTMLLTATGKTATLPTAAGITGRVYTIKLTASGTGTVATTSSQTIDGNTTYSLSAQYKYVMVQSDGSNWNIIANN